MSDFKNIYEHIVDKVLISRISQHPAEVVETLPDDELPF
jgi:hypothetical protein